MRMLVTGATGFIGSAVCAACARAGHDVVALSRDAVSARRRLPMVHAVHAWPDPVGTLPPPAALDGAGAVVHLLGEPVNGRWTAAKKKQIRDSRVLSTRNLVAAMARMSRPPAVLVSASAAGYYGDRGEQELGEGAPSGTGFLADVCRDWEAEALKAAPLGARVVRLRTAYVLGEGGVLGTLVPLHRWGLGGPIAGGRQWWPWVHIMDAVGLVVLALEAGVTGPLNVAAPQPVRQREFARALGRVLGRPALLPAPRLAVKLVLGEFATEVLASRRLVPQAALAEGYRFRFTDLDAALRDALGKPRAAR